MTRGIVVILAGLMTLLGGFWYARADQPSRVEDLPLGGLSIFESPSPKGTVLVVHSVFQDRATTYPICRALRDSGFRAVSVHLKSGSPFYRYVDELTAVMNRFGKTDKLYLLGHSMGADLLLNAAATREDVERFACLGFPAQTELVNCEVLIGAGVWDQVHSPRDLRTAAGPHRAFFSSTCDHSQETLDPTLTREVCVFFSADPPYRYGNSVLGLGLSLLGLTTMAFLIIPASATQKAAGLTSFCVVLANALFPSPLLVAPGLAVWLTCSLKSAWPQNPATTIFSALKQLLLLMTLVALSWSLHAYQSVIAHPSVLLGLPVAVSSWPPILAARLTEAVASVQVMSVNVALLGLLGSEALRPGLWSRPLREYLHSLRARAQRSKPTERKKPGWKQVLVLLALVLVCAGLWWQVSTAGYSLNLREVWRLCRKFFLLLILPIGLFVVAQRKLAP